MRKTCTCSGVRTCAQGLQDEKKTPRPLHCAAQTKGVVQDIVQRQRLHWQPPRTMLWRSCRAHVSSMLAQVVFTLPPTAVSQLQASEDGDPPPGTAANPFAVMRVRWGMPQHLP